MTFDFENDNYINLNVGSLPPTQRTDLNRVLIQVNGENNTDRVIAFIDDVLYLNPLTANPVFNKLVWSDEFNGSGNINFTKRFYQTQLPQNGSWFNGEIQHYTNRSINSSVYNCVLKIVAKRENFSDQGFI